MNQDQALYRTIRRRLNDILELLDVNEIKKAAFELGRLDNAISMRVAEIDATAKIDVDARYATEKPE